MENRIALLKAMHEYILTECQNEYTFDYWLVVGVPDEPSENDFEFIAGDDESFREVCMAFAKALEIEDDVNEY